MAKCISDNQQNLLCIFHKKLQSFGALTKGNLITFEGFTLGKIELVECHHLNWFIQPSLVTVTNLVSAVDSNWR